MLKKSLLFSLIPGNFALQILGSKFVRDIPI
jgi:hypothetical protein